MKFLKKLIVPVLLVALLATCLLTSCKQECIHEYGEWTVSKEVSCTENGEMTRTCALCGNTETSVTTATGHEAGELVCGKCDTAIVSIDSLFPTVSEDVQSVGIVVHDVLLSEAVEGMPLSIELAELVFYLDESGAPAVYGEGEAKIGETDTVSYIAFSDSDKIYLEINLPGEGPRYIEASISDLMLTIPEISDALEMVNEVLPAFEKWLNESFLPVFTTPEIPVEMPEVTEDQARLAAAKVIDLFFNVTTTDNGAVVTLDLSIIKEVNNALNEKTVDELIDAIGGEGSFTKLQAMIPTVLDFTGDDLIKFLSLNLGMDVPAFIDSLDGLAVIITGYPDATLEMLLEIDGDIGEIINSEEFRASSVKDILMASMSLSTEEELNAVIAEAILTLKSKTVYQLIEIDPTIPAQISDAVDAITEALTLEITVDKDGKFAGTKLTVTVPDANVYATLTVNVKGEIRFNMNDGEGTNELNIDILPGYLPTKDTERMAAVKAQFESLPEINADILDYTYLYPVFVSDELVGAITVYNANIVEEDGVKYLVVDVVEGEITTPIIRIIGEKCGTTTLYTYEITVNQSYRYFAIDEATANDPEADLMSLAYELVSYGEEIKREKGYHNTYSFDFCHDSESGAVRESYNLHALEYDYENSVFENDVSCGESYCEIERCADCGLEEIYSGVKGHEASRSEINHNIETNVVTVDIYCSCGEYFSTHYYTVAPNELNLTPREREYQSNYVDFTFTVTEAGTYRIYVSNVDGNERGYSHVYPRNSYKDTLNFGGDEVGYIDIYLEEGEGYLTLLYNDPENVLDILIGIERID